CDQLGVLGQHAHALDDVFVLHQHDLVDVPFDDGVGVLARHTDSQTVGDRVLQRQRGALLVDAAVEVLGGQRRFRPHHTHGGSAFLDGRGNAGDETAAAHGDDDGVHVGQVFQDFAANGS